ncbi:MAG: LysR family transcriptional regulator [Neisseria sp.]|nr:LysR family transcriptional regulator [Neisseria sp.]
MEINNIGDVSAFIAAAKSGSFTAAAKQLGLTRSTIGKRIARLEARLNVRLLQRTTRSLSLTDEGGIFFERCVAVLEELENAESLLAQRTAEPSGRLRISAPLVLGRQYVADLLADYMRRWPQVQVEASFGDRYVDLIEEGFDVALRVGDPAPDSRFSARTVGIHRMITCAAPAYLAAHGTPQTPADLRAHQCLHFVYGRQLSPWHFQADGREVSFTGKGRASADSAEALLTLCRAGFGLVHFPRYIVAEDLRAGRLQAVLADFQAKGVPIRALYPSRRQLSPKVRQFIDMLAEAWQPQVPWERG